MPKPSEKELDKAIEEAFKTNPAFTDWFLSKSKFANEAANYFWSRSDHPWGRVEVTSINPETGLNEISIREGETDILVVFKADSSKRFAIHLENKIASGKFTPGQPELYLARATAWLDNPKYGSYEDFEIILVAPQSFYDHNLAEAQKFHRFIPHEEISTYIPVFGCST